jgi:electron transport complex protein RnfB
VDAIIGSAKLMHTVSSLDCTGCELCLPVCPVDCIYPSQTSEKDSPLFQESLLARAPDHRAHFRQRAERLGNSDKPHRVGNSLAMKKTIADSVARARGKRDHIRGNAVCREKDTAR